MNEQPNNVLTASRMGVAMRCLRQHFWACEVGLRKDEVTLALRVGSAWARGMDARWAGGDYDAALVAAIPEGVLLDDYTCATIASLLAGYYDHYALADESVTIHPEQEFRYELGLGFEVAGKLDGLGSEADGNSVLIEAKTTRESLAPDSDYWMRLTFNMQVYQYVLAARREGWDLNKVLYDVTRKPAIRPSQVDDLDAKGLKIVRDAEGKRVYLLAGKNKGQPRQSGDSAKGYVVQSHVESPDEFSDRLWRDTTSRPEFYFCRREIPILEDQLRAFERQRLAIARLILSLRENENDLEGHRDPDAWPRNVSKDTCSFCPYQSFCLQNISVNPHQPPAGFSVQPFNQELTHDDTATEENAPDATA